jgi:hypothetical protein
MKAKKGVEVQLHPFLTLAQDGSSPYPMKRRLSGHQWHSGHCREEMNSLPLLGFEAQITEEQK